MRTFVAGLVVLGGFVLVNLIGAVAFLAAGKLALHLDPAANESHLSGFIVAITGVAVAVGSAFPIFGRAVPWVAARLKPKARDFPPHPERCPVGGAARSR